ncbi:DUF222 domain-containing protein [Gordonia jinghuaiqii]|uniref:DUF222 domain-containing protein n=1 Tax=Gordonia jinghuaiqii TaxID=2758710 RepID=A0A7D7R4P5_9ACTN|nr:HNH endonuclease signature motif containing protein [Gordonia jinghuaiqii]MCR5978591.1 DUF222 domain-containing protein [Gordonia jinghuaiqii]QMT02912.1 DUF222 domain-containing protein [Gordonia jinghuaiqii]
MPSITEIRDHLTALDVPADPTGKPALVAIDELRLLRNAIDHQIAVHVAAFDDSGAAEKVGSTTRRVLIEMGMPPAAAHRYSRIGSSLEALPKVADCAAEGYLATECVDAIVRGIAHVEKRCSTELSDEQRQMFESELLSQAFSGAAPAEIDEHARSIGHRIADAGDGGVPAAEDATLNSVTGHVTGDGRVEIAADVTAVIGEKFLSMIDERSCPRPEPDGAADRRSREQRWADGFEVLLDQAAIGATVTTAGSPRTQVLVTIPADATEPARLPWVGSISHATATQLSCDATLTEIVIDDQGVPLEMGTSQRLFPPHLRRAVIVRDECCVKCGAPASHTQVHHIVHWADGGPTDLGNGCLLCQRCHTQVHHHGWDVVMGPDRHPWLMPPADIDPERRPLSAYNRRTMRLDDMLV